MKYVCFFEGGPFFAAFTSVNIHNPQTSTVTFEKKVIDLGFGAFPAGDDPSPSDNPKDAVEPTEPLSQQIGSDYALQIDCEDIHEMGKGTKGDESGSVAGFDPTEGFVVIQSPKLLNISVVYQEFSAFLAEGASAGDGETAGPGIPFFSDLEIVQIQPTKINN